MPHFARICFIDTSMSARRNKLKEELSRREFGFHLEQISNWALRCSAAVQSSAVSSIRTSCGFSALSNNCFIRHA